MCAAEERWCAAPRELDLSALAGHSKDLGFETVSTRQQDHAPLLRFLMLVTAGSAEGSWFPLRSPVRGKSNAGWRRSAACLVRFLLPFFAPGRTVPAQGCVSGRPSNRSLAMALTPPAARWLPPSSSPRSAAATPPDSGRDRCSGRNCRSAA